MLNRGNDLWKDGDGLIILFIAIEVWSVVKGWEDGKRGYEFDDGLMGFRWDCGTLMDEGARRPAWCKD